MHMALGFIVKNINFIQQERLRYKNNKENCLQPQ